MGEIFSKTCALDYGRPRPVIGQPAEPGPRGPRRVFPAGPVMELEVSGTSLLCGMHHKNFSTETSGPTCAGGASFRGCLNPQPTSSPEPPPGPSVRNAWPWKHEEWSPNKERGRAASKQEEVRIVDIP